MQSTTPTSRREDSMEELLNLETDIGYDHQPLIIFNSQLCLYIAIINMDGIFSDGANQHSKSIGHLNRAKEKKQRVAAVS
jgi:hypothetical protein